MLKVTGIIYIILSALGLLACLVLIALGLAAGTDDGLGWGVVTALITLGVLAVPSSAFGLVAGILGAKWCARPDKAQVLFVLGVVLAVAAALSLLIDLGSGGISSSAGDIVRLVLMLAITFWVGALGLVGAIFMIAPPEIPPELGMHMPLDIRPLGAILFLIAISYLIVCKFIHKPIHIFGKEFAFPPFKIAVAQAVVAGADLVAAGACLYVLLPPDAHVSFLQFLPTYLMAMVAVVLTHVPGGAGVLEVVILHLTTASPQAVFAALLCFRVIYYLLPLLLAAVIFAIYEVRQQAIQESGVLHDAGRWMRAFAPTIMASAVFGIGAILCFYVVLPVSPERLAQIREWIPLGIVEFASMATGVAGVMLLFLTRGIQHRQRAAFRLAIAMLCIGIIGPLLHSLSWFVALMSLIVLLSVLSIRRKCCRPSSLWKLHLTPSWLFAIVSVLVCSAGLGLLIYHMDPSDPVLWTSSDYAADAARLFRTFAAEALLLICIAVGYMRTAPIRKRWNAVRRFGRRNKQ